ncbi:hypothetical protein [Nocardioides jensenii]|uniref:hypothetical protein n=1 Tax=Nocardioides jensenii TaxID=1843 RepID=UPI0012FB4019|nr:hypothetical protein [Nocardioides jensenii]
MGDESLCLRCSACLRPGKARQAEPITRDEHMAAYAGVTGFDLAYRAYAAQTVTEVEQLEHLALLVVGFPVCKKDPVLSPTGKTTPPIDKHLATARVRVGGTHNAITEEAREIEAGRRALAAEQRRRDRHDAWAEKETRREQIGFVNAEHTKSA